MTSNAKPDTTISEAAASTSPLPMMEREDWNRRYTTKELVWTANANRFLMEETVNLTPSRALDLAAGEGRNAVWLAEQGWQVQAVDFSDVAIEKANQLAAARGVTGRLTFEVADLRTYALKPCSFDLVSFIYFHLPFSAMAPILASASQAVAQGGTFLLIAHDASNIERGYGGPQHPGLLYTAEQVVPALGDAFEIEKAGAVERSVNTDNGVKTAIDCIVRAKRVR